MKKQLLILVASCFIANLFAQTTGGPDAFGYTWITSDNPAGPTYNWIDITSTGTKVVGLEDDNSVGFFPMSDFRYYNQTVNQLKIGSNGWISFNNISNISNCFPPIPTVGANGDNYIAPFMGDFNLNGASNPAQVWYYDDLANNRFIVSFISMGWWIMASPNYIGDNTFQVILNRADSSITFQYQKIDNINFINKPACPNDVSIGIENSTGTIGIQYGIETPPANNFAIKFEYPHIISGSKESAFEKEIQVSPNPTSGNVNITFEKEQKEVQIIVRDLLGKSIDSYDFLNTNKIDIDLKGPKGVYFIEITAKNQQAIFKTIKK